MYQINSFFNLLLKQYFNDIAKLTFKWHRNVTQLCKIFASFPFCNKNGRQLYIKKTPGILNIM